MTNNTPTNRKNPLPDFIHLTPALSFLERELEALLFLPPLSFLKKEFEAL